MRKAFSMFTALFVMVLMALLAVFILNISAKAVKTTVFNYKKEQAVLYAKSYTELAIMAATANDSNTTPCAETITGSIGPNPTSGEGYDINTTISYIGNGLACTNVLNGTDVITTPNTLYIIVDTFVRYKPILDANAKWFTYHRRTLQKL